MKQARILVEAFAENPRFFHKPVVEKLFSHCAEVLHGKDDIPIEDLAQSAVHFHALGNFYLLELCCNVLTARDLHSLELPDQVLLLEVIADVMRGEEGLEGRCCCWKSLRTSCAAKRDWKVGLVVFPGGILFTRVVVPLLYVDVGAGPRARRGAWNV